MSNQKIGVSQSKKAGKISWKEKAYAASATRQKIDYFTITMRSLREMAEKEAKLVQCAMKDMEGNLIDPKHILELTKSIHGTGEKSISEYINRNTEILLNEHASVIRQQVIEKMKLQMQEISNELTQTAQKLENNITDFFELIESSYESASDSFTKVIKLAEENYEKEELITKTKDSLFSIQREVQKLEEELLECLMCYAFLDSLFPSDQKGKMIELPKDFLKSFGPSFEQENRREMHKKVIDDIITSGENLESFEVKIESGEEILKVIDRLKDSNFSLVQNSHLNKGSLEFERKELSEVKKKMKEDLESYDLKITSVKNEIEKAKEIQEKLKLQLTEVQEDSSAKEKIFQREKEMKKMSELYNLCTESDAKNVDMFLMKVAIDDCLEDLFNELSKHPKRKVRDMLKALEAEKKLKERKREEALRAERLQKKLEKRARFAKITL